MGRWRVIWNKRAQERFEQIASWYTLNMGPQSAKEFAKDVYPKSVIRAGVSTISNDRH